MKDRSHYGVLVRDEILMVTPEQAATWLDTRPPPPIMWSRGGATGAKAHRYAEDMRAERWDHEKTSEPVMISEDHGYILGGHHRCKAVTLLGRPQELKVQFWSKPKGWDRQKRAEREAASIARARRARQYAAHT